VVVEVVAGTERSDDFALACTLKAFKYVLWPPGQRLCRTPAVWPRPGDHHRSLISLAARSVRPTYTPRAALLTCLAVTCSNI
jgi:hypothetical protein